MIAAGPTSGRPGRCRDAVDERHTRPVRVEDALKRRELALPSLQRDVFAHRDKSASSDDRGLGQPMRDTGRPVEYAEATDRDVHETGCRADSGEQVRLEEGVDGVL